MHHGICSKDFDRENAIFDKEAIAFIQVTQKQIWDKLEILHGDKTGERIIAALCKWMDEHGALNTLRHGFKCYGKTIRIAFFKPAHGLNPELESRYAANILGITRQLHFSPKTKESLDVTLSINGIPVIEVSSQVEAIAQAAQANPIDKFQLVFGQELESLFIERMELNEDLFARYMNDPEFKELVSQWLGQQVYARIPKNISYRPQKRSKKGIT